MDRNRTVTATFEPLPYIDIASGYMLWNSVNSGTAIVPVTGDWGAANRWQSGNTLAPPGAWVAGRSALFAAPTGAAGAYGITVNTAASADSMRFEFNGYTIQSPSTGSAPGLTVRNIIIQPSVTATVNAPLAGANLLSIRGGGVLTLGGNQPSTYTGGTTILAGTTVNANKNNAFGASGLVTVTATGARLNLQGAILPNAITIADSSLRTSGTASTVAGNITLSGANVAIPVDANLTLSGLIVGTGNLNKTGAGMLTLDGASSSYTGTVAVNQGNLTVGNTGALVGRITTAAAGNTVTFNRASGSVTQNGISGPGSLVKLGAGTLILTGANSTVHTGTTRVAGGTLQVANGTALGSGGIFVENLGRLQFEVPTGIATFGGRVDSSGTFVKSGAGTLTLTGGASSLVSVGTLVVSGGTLNVNYDGSAALSADSVLVAAGARLGGTASVGNANARISVNGGTLAGRNYYGTVNVGNNGVLHHDGIGGQMRFGALNLVAGSQIDLTLTEDAKTQAPIRVEQAIALGGAALSIPHDINDTHIGVYQIAQSLTSSITGNLSPTVTVAGGAPDGYTLTLSQSGGIVRLTVVKETNTSDVKNPLRVVRAALVTDEATGGGSLVELEITGFDEFRLEHLSSTGNPRVVEGYVWYKPGSRVNPLGDDTTAMGGMITLPVSRFPTPGNTLLCTLHITSAKRADTVYHFNAGVTWIVDGDRLPQTISAGASTFVRNPRALVAPNGLTLRAEHTLQTDGTIDFRLEVSGQNSAALTPVGGGEYRPSVDSVGVWIVRGGTGLTSASLVGNSLSPAGISAGGGTVEFLGFTLSGLRSENTFTHRAAPIPAGVNSEAFYFAVAPRWTLDSVVDSVARPLAVTRSTVANPNVPLPKNPCYVVYEQPNRRQPRINVSVLRSEDFDELAALVRVQLSYDPSFANTFADTTVGVARVGADQGFTFAVTNDTLSGPMRDVFYKVTVMNADGVGRENTGEFKNDERVGRPAPLPPANIRAYWQGEGVMRLNWDAVTLAANNVGEPAASHIYVAYSRSHFSPNVNVSSLDNAVRVPATATGATIEGLDTMATYWFAVEVHDVMSGMSEYWTIRSAAAIDEMATGPWSVVRNIVEITAVTFIPDSTYFRVNYRMTEDTYGPNAMLRYFVVRGTGTDTVITPQEQALTLYNRGDSASLFTLQLGEKLMFDTEYYVYMYTVSATDGPAADRSGMRVEVGAFTRQTVVLGPNESAFVNNGRFGISTEGWTLTVSDFSCITTVSKSDGIGGGESAPGAANFTFLGDYGYSYTVNAGSFQSLLEPFTVSIEAGLEKLGTHSTDDVRIYRFTGNSWDVLHDTRYVPGTGGADGYFTGTAIAPAHEEQGSTYRLMVSTQKPVVWADGSMISGRAPRPVLENIGLGMTDQFAVQSNIGNVRVSLLVGPANNSATLTAASMTASPRAIDQVFSFDVNAEVTRQSANIGVFAFLLVSDGRTTDTINVSRSVRSPSYDGFTVNPEPRVWRPFAAQANLDKRSARDAIEDALFRDGDEFAFHDTLFRLFRWYPNSDNLRSRDKWVEFGAVHDSVFDINPGRLMWIKTASGGSHIPLGATTSSSLVEDFTVVLPPGEWTDFVLPFNYDVCLGDIIDATDGSSSLEMYRWKRPDKGRYSYVADTIMLMRPDSSLRLKGGEDAFTVRNSGTSTVTLRVPPTPAFMSRYGRANAGPRLAKAQDAAENRWHFTIRTRTEDSDLSDVIVGYNRTERKFAIPPSFSNEAVVVVGENNALMGHYLSSALSKGGQTFRLRFYNDNSKTSTFRFNALFGENIPSGTSVMFVSAATGKEIVANDKGEYQLKVSGASYEDVHMITGSSRYQARVVSGPAGTKFAVGRIVVNQAARSAKIRYYAPFAGVSKVEVAVYDVRGRALWKNTDDVRPSAWGAMEWRSRDSKRGAVAAGLYIVRVRAIDGKGKTVAVENRRIMFSR